MPIINLNKVISVWTGENIRNWSFGEKIELIRMLVASLERDYDTVRTGKQ